MTREAEAAAVSKDLVISTDLPLQGASATQSDSTNKMIQLYLEQIGSKAGDYNITLKTYDDSTAAKGAWDDAACAKNATDHVANENEVAVMGTFNSGCAKIEVPTLNQDSTGPMLMVSHANTNPGLTKKWDTGEPDKYYPTGTRNYARVVTTDDYQGQGAAQFAARRPQGQEGLRAQRQPDLRARRGQGVRGLGARSWASRSSASSPGTPSSPTTPPSTRR